MIEKRDVSPLFLEVRGERWLLSPEELKPRPDSADELAERLCRLCRVHGDIDADRVHYDHLVFDVYFNVELGLTQLLAGDPVGLAIARL